MRNFWEKAGNYKGFIDFLTSVSGQTMEQLINPERDPFLPGLSEVVNTIWNFIRQYPDAPITLIGDYDEDGMASCEIMSILFYHLTGRWVDVIIPDRVQDGYGFNMSFIDRCSLKDKKGMIITVDNGITAIKEVEAAKAKGFQVVVIDHHQPLASGELPQADALMDPHTVEGDHFKDYCAAGLCLRTAKELLKLARIEDPVLVDKLTAFAATATITDVVPLIGDNRNIVRDGIKVMKARKCTAAMNMLLDLLKLNNLDEEDIGFTLGPVFNAAGRMPEGHPDLMVATMVEDQKSEGLKSALSGFISLNEARKQLVSKVEESIQIPEGEFPVVVYVPDMPLGVVGILAGHLAESANTAAFVFADDGSGTGIIKGSARAGESGVHLKNMLDYCQNLLVTAGGHEKAAGLSLKSENLKAFQKACRAYMEANGCVPKEPSLSYHLVLDANEIGPVNRQLMKLAPFGEKVPKPVFLIEHFVCIPDDKGMPYKVSSKAQASEWIQFHGVYANASSFRGLKNRWIQEGCPLKMNLLGTLGTNEFRNIVTNEIRLLDFEPVEEEILQAPEESGEEKEEVMKQVVTQQAPAQNPAAPAPQQANTVAPVAAPVQKVDYGKVLKDIPVGKKDIVVCAVMGIEESVTSQGSAYCKLTLADSSKDIQTANLWDITTETLEKMGVMIGGIYSFAISVKLYQDARSYTVQGKSRKTDIMEAPQGANLADFIPSAPAPGQELYNLTLKYVENFCTSPIKELVVNIYHDHHDQLLSWGAAKANHHAYLGGLIWHQTSMVEEAYGLMMGRRFKDLNKSVVIAACALHDIGKLKELETDALGSSEYTESGNMFGHLLLGYDLIRDYAVNMGILDNEEVKHLLHIIISHHGNLEWGAVKKPLTREANLVHIVDLLDSSDEEFLKEYESLEPGEMMKSTSRVLRVPVVKPTWAQ